MSDTVYVSTDTWTTSSTTTSTGSSDSNDLVNDLFKTLGDLLNGMTPVFFLNSMQNLITAIEDFGSGMNGALACVSTDLTVVASGLSAAASAFADTDKDLANTFAQLDGQLGYYTNTTTSAKLNKPTAANEAALSAAYQQYYNSDPGGNSFLGLSQQQINNIGKSAAAAAAAAAGGSAVYLLLGLCLI